MVPYLIVYVAPLASFAMMAGVAALLHDRGMRPTGPSMTTLLFALAAPAIEGLRDLGMYVRVVIHLALIAAFSVRPHPVTLVVSFVAVAWWLLYGVMIVSLGG